MALPLAFAISAVPAKADLARGEAEFLRGNAHCDAREFSDALASYDRAAAFGYEDHVMWNNRGVALDGLGRHEDSDACTGLGDALYAVERYEEAVEAYDRAIAAEPNNEEAWNNKGFTFFMLGIHEEALACYEKALAINPRYKQAWYNKGYTFHGINRLEEAVRADEKAIAMDRGEQVRWNNIGNALYNTLILNGSFDEAWVFRGKILEEMGNALEAERCYDEALECFRASLEIEPDNAELRYHQAILLEDLERLDEAIDGYAAAASKAHGADSLLRLSALLLRVGRAADALVPADDLRARDPSDPRGWLAAGRALLALGRATEAEASFRKAAELGAPEAHAELARTLQILGRADDALAVLAGIVAPSNETLLLQADLYASLGRMDEALADCDAAIRANADGRDLVYRRKGELLLRSHRSKEAMAAFDAALGLNPTDPDIWCDAARAWRTLGQEDRARKMVDQALRLDPTFSRALDLRSASPASG